MGIAQMLIFLFLKTLGDWKFSDKILSTKKDNIL